MTLARSLALWIIAILALAAPATAHEIGVLNVEIHAQDAGRIDITITSDADHLAAVPALGLKLPAGADRAALEALALDLARILAPTCQILADGQPHPIGTLIDARAILPGELGPNLPPSPRLVLTFSATIPHTSSTFGWRTSLEVGQYLLRIQREGEPEPMPLWLKPGKASPNFPLHFDPATQSAPPVSPDSSSSNTSATPPPTNASTSTIIQYLVLGFTHILPDGLDHILFVLGLFLAATLFRPLLLQITAFTIAHSISLALAMLGLVHLSPAIVEPAIAASIVFVAVENILFRTVGWRRAAIVFAFGLIHGLGFAGVLAELGLPRGQFAPALISFNVGVELGQLAVIAAAFLALGWFRNRPWYRSRIVIPCSGIIACVGLFWTAQRLWHNH